MRKGSVTVFLALSMVLILSYLFAMLEGARIHCMKGKADLVTQLCGQSLLGNYHQGLWENYGLLFLDGSNMQKLCRSVEQYAIKNLESKEGWDLTTLKVGKVELDHFQVATDYQGKVFLEQVCKVAKQEMTEDVFRKLVEYGLYRIQIKGEENNRELLWQQALDAMEEAKTMGVESEEPKVDATDLVRWENPMEYVESIMNSGILTLVLGSPLGLSGNVLSDRSSVEERELQEGTKHREPEIEGMSHLYLQYYVQNHFSNYVSASEKGVKDPILCYEMEYLIGGANNDSENLELVVNKLLEIREIMNFVTIMSDQAKVELANLTAVALVGFTGLLPLISAVQMGILLAWAYVESIMDVRALLAGERIPFFKTTDQWISVLDCRENVESTLNVKGHSKGLNYSEYLQILLSFCSLDNLVYRSMDLMEQNEGIKMDQMIQVLDTSITYEAKPLFWNYNVLSSRSWKGYQMTTKQQLSYVY